MEEVCIHLHILKIIYHEHPLNVLMDLVLIFAMMTYTSILKRPQHEATQYALKLFFFS